MAFGCALLLARAAERPLVVARSGLADTGDSRARGTCQRRNWTGPVMTWCAEWVRSARGSAVFGSDADLQARAERCNRAYFGGTLNWRSIRFVGNQNGRFGSCTPAHGTIRISDRLAQVPDFVLDYVVVHELAHLLEPNHSPRFWELVYRYDRGRASQGLPDGLGSRG